MQSKDTRGKPQLFTASQSIKGQMCFLDQRSVVVASLLIGRGKDANGKRGSDAR